MLIEEYNDSEMCGGEVDGTYDQCCEYLGGGLWNWPSEISGVPLGHCKSAGAPNWWIKLASVQSGPYATQDLCESSC